MNSRSASIVGDQEAAGSSSFAWCNRQWLSSQALTRRSSVRPKQAVLNHNLLWLPESNAYPLWYLSSGPFVHTVLDLMAAREYGSLTSTGKSPLGLPRTTVPCFPQGGEHAFTPRYLHHQPGQTK